MDAYRRLTRELTNMHASERDLLDAAGSLYGVLMASVSVGDDLWAAETAEQHFRTEAGDRWRVKAATGGLIETDQFRNVVG